MGFQYSFGLRHRGLLFLVLLYHPSQMVLADLVLESAEYSTPPAQVAGTEPTLTVGPDSSACDYTSLNTAINAAPEGGLIKLANGMNHFGFGYVVSSRALTIQGGYEDCNASSPVGRTVIDIGGSGRVFNINDVHAPGGPVRLVVLENLVIRGGGGDLGAGILVQGRPGTLQVALRNVEISGNTRSGVDGHGAGLRILTTSDAEGGGTMVNLDNLSIVKNNISEGDGGGIYCQSSHDNGGVALLTIGSSRISDNQARNGGALAIDGCKNVFLHNGGPAGFVDDIPIVGGLINNTALLDGGAIMVLNGGEVVVRGLADVFFGSSEYGALIEGNTAGLHGGAIAIVGEESAMTISDAWIVGNSSGTAGGAFRVTDGGHLNIGRSESEAACKAPFVAGGLTWRPPCSVIQNNTSGSGGAFSLSGDVEVDINRTSILGNSATGVGAVLHGGNLTATIPGPRTRMEAVVVSANQANDIFHLGNSAVLNLYHSTLANNVGGRLVHMEADSGGNALLRFYTTILQHTGTLVNKAPEGNHNARADCVIGNQDISEIPFDTIVAYSNIDPQFVNPAAGNFRLSDSSPAIDYCDGINAPLYPDHDGNARGQEWTGPPPDSAPNPLDDGVYDLGAFEAFWTRIFLDRFEAESERARQ